jgi:hypothetical protein
VWPDVAPTGIYAEQLAQAMHERGHQVWLVGGKGTYRSSLRPKPAVAPIYLDHFIGKRGNLYQEFKEYYSVKNAFANYIKSQVQTGDVVIVTSAPPVTIALQAIIHKKKAVSIYWLQDYYPELLGSIVPLPFAWLWFVSAFWNRSLKKWNHVIKISSNLGYQEHNSKVIRNWATLSFTDTLPPKERTALYAGNLGYAHDVVAFIKLCKKLHNDGYTISVRGDGIGMKRLPSWIQTGPSFQREEDLTEACLSSEILLAAAHPKISRALFPSKIWNYLAAGRTVLTSGFSEKMAMELETIKQSDPYEGLQIWCDWLEELLSINL